MKKLQLIFKHVEIHFLAKAVLHMFWVLGCFFALLKGTLYCISMNKTVLSNKVYFTRPNKDTEASEDEIKDFEKSAIANFSKGKEVFIIEKFPKKFFYFATKIRIEKVAENVSTLSVVSNSRLFKVFSTYSMYE